MNNNELDIETYRGLLDQDSNTMKSTDLHKFVYEATGKYKELKSLHTKIREVMCDKKTQTKEEILEVMDYAPTLRPNNNIQYFNLSKVEVDTILKRCGLEMMPNGKVIKVVSERLMYQYEHAAICAVEQLLEISLVRQYRVGDYRVDGYCIESNTGYEIDEPSHSTPANSIKDDERQK